jgi:hypothetical protein
MQPYKYDHATAKAIFEMIGWPESWVIRDDGVFVEDGFRCSSPIDKAFDWTPAYDMDWPGAPNPMTAPTLPIEFTARELAASMIDGVGRQIQDALNSRIGYALDDAALQDLCSGSHRRWVREALTEAYDVARQAQDVVGELDHDQQQRAYDLSAQYGHAYGQALEREKVMERVIIGKHKNGNPEYGGFIATGDEYLLRLARAKESVAVQKAQAEQAKEQADAALKAWRKAMVRQLLQPQATTPSPAPVVPTSEESAEEDAYARKAFETWRKTRIEEWIDQIKENNAFMDDFDKLKEDVKYWEGRDDTRASDAEIKQSKLKPLHAQMTEFIAIHKLLRGDYGDYWPKVIMPSPAPQALPVATDSAPGGVETDKAGPVNRGWVMKKAALIKKHTYQWATIKGDFHSASENGLSQAAKAPGHGEWVEADALKWAEQRGKLKNEREQGPATLGTVWTGKKHTIDR